jgi:hypothetical protein
MPEKGRFHILVHICVAAMLWVGTGCKEEMPETTLPSDEVLVSLLCDLHLAEASLNKISIARQDTVVVKIRERIAATYGISPAKMDEWLEALQKSPEHNIAVYDSVIVELERRLIDSGHQ